MKPHFLFFPIFFILFIFAQTSCRFPYKTPFNQSKLNKDEETLKLNHLSKSDAEKRAQFISNVQYQLHVKLDRTDRYEGFSEIDFDWIKNKHPLRIDFFGGEIKKFSINFEKRNYFYDGKAFYIPPEFLKKGKNAIRIHFTKTYNTYGQGFIRFQDPEDKKIYLYTHFEPYGANEFFPFFDQPDLKATYTLKVEAPKEWKVISSMKEYKIKKINQNKKLWYFPKSFKFSTYLFSLHAGPYKMWKSKYKNIPLRLFSRQTQAKYVYPKIWFNITQKGLKFFPNYFKTNYPYSKYDQIIVPVLSFLGMENVAAVTFNESLLFRDSPTDLKKFSLAGVIFHELVHMWFGNLVTMKWWDDLWLNESFASYMAFFGLEKKMKNKFPWNPWMHFYSGYKYYAYELDESKEASHPIIHSQVKSTLEALSQFDSITYAKGQATLKNLARFMGEAHFREKLKVYFDLYSEKNTTWRDLLRTLEEESGEKKGKEGKERKKKNEKAYKKSLRDWNEKWLKTKGFNSISVNFRCKKNKITHFNIIQSVHSGDPEIRPHSLLIELYNFNPLKTNISKRKTIAIKISEKKKSLDALIGEPCPDIVYPNGQDASYIKVNLDSVSKKNALSSIDKVSSSFLRLLLFIELWKEVRDGHLSLFQYKDLIYNQLKIEKNRLILKFMSQVIGGRFQRSSLYSYFPKKTEQEKKIYLNFASKIEKTIWKRLQAAKSRNEKIFWRDVLIEKAQTPYALERIYELFKEQKKIKGLSLKDPILRWSILTLLSEFQFKDVKNLIKTESLKDSSYEGKLGLIRAQSIAPHFETKTKWIQEILNNKSHYSKKEKKEISIYLFPLSQEHLSQKYSSKFFEDLLTFSKRQKTYSLRFRFSYLFPFLCDKKFERETKKFIKHHGYKIQHIERKNLSLYREEIQRCLNVRKI